MLFIRRYAGGAVGAELLSVPYFLGASADFDINIR